VELLDQVEYVFLNLTYSSKSCKIKLELSCELDSRVRNLEFFELMLRIYTNFVALAFAYSILSNLALV